MVGHGGRGEGRGRIIKIHDQDLDRKVTTSVTMKIINGC